MRRFWTFFIFIVIILTVTTTAFASWLIFHKPEFRGKVIDAETKEPIEGAVVVVMYKTDTIISGPGGGHASIIKIKETLTDENGEFYISSYTTIIQPNSTEDDAEFIIYKPGYGKYPSHRASPTHVIIELPRLKTWKERNWANMISISDIPESRWPQLNEMIEKEEEWLRHNKGWRR